MVQDKEILVSEVSEEWVKKMWVTGDRKSRWSAMAENYISLDAGGNTNWNRLWIMTQVLVCHSVCKHVYISSSYSEVLIDLCTLLIFFFLVKEYV